jgi:hypothetical protein
VAKFSERNVPKALGGVLGRPKAGDPEQTHVSSVRYCQAFADDFGEQYNGMTSQDVNEVFTQLVGRLRDGDSKDTAGSVFEAMEIDEVS